MQSFTSLLAKVGRCNENKIRPFFAAIIYFRVPVIIALISFFISIYVDQTLDIYRLIILENNYRQAFVSTAFITILSILIWYSGRLLQIEKNQLIDYPAVESTSANYSTKLYLRILPRVLGGIPLASLGIGIFKSTDSSVGWLFVLLFFGSLITGVLSGIRVIEKCKTIFGFIPDNILYALTAGFWIGLGSYIAKVDSSAPNLFFEVWIIFCCLVTVATILLFIYRKKIFKQENVLEDKIDPQKLVNFLGADTRAGLFDTKFECFFINIAYICFCALSLPIIAADSKKSFGVLAVLILGLIVNALLLWWRRNQRDEQILITVVGLISLAISTSFLFILPTVGLVNNIGAVSILAIALSIFVIIFSTIYHWGIESKIPALTLLIGILLISSFFNWNDNHQIRQLATSEPRILPSLQDSFTKWLNSREDLQEYDGKPYPVYLVATQGGGIFAAYHSATALSKLQDSFPNFSHHIFAISSVSGGSLGAAAFSSLVKENVTSNESKNLETKAQQLFSKNLLSPLLSMGLFPDFVQRFLFFPIAEWDRARGLEIAFEEAWDNTQVEADELASNDRNPLKSSYYDLWNSQGISPALVMNTTEVETGEPLRISPFLIPLPVGDENVFNRGDVDFRLSTAAGLSARFPFVTPVGWYKQERADDKNPQNKTSTKSRLADGGYFDNSGVSTALDIGRTLQGIKGYQDKFDIIYISIIDLPNGSLSNKVRTQGLNEVGSPIRTLFNVRSARGKNVVKQAKYLLNAGIEDAFHFKFRNIYLDKITNNGNLPLGWLLSQSSRDAIDRQNTAFEECDEDKYQKESDDNLEVGNHNSCVAKSIGYDLKQLNDNSLK